MGVLNMSYIKNATELCRKLLSYRWAMYMLKAFAIVAALYLFAKAAPFLPLLVIGLFWTVLSAVSSLGFAYQVVVRKMHRQLILEEGGRLSKLNNGRIFW